MEPSPDKEIEGELENTQYNLQNADEVNLDTLLSSSGSNSEEDDSGENDEDDSDSDDDDSSNSGSNSGSNSMNDGTADIELGDQIIVEDPDRGTTIGRVYYMDNDIVKIMPDGTSDRVVKFTYDELEAHSKIIEKHVVEGFVRQQNIQPGQLMNTFTADGRLLSKYMVKDVNAKKDRITITEEGGEDIIVNFTTATYTGIPSELLGGAEVILVREPPQEVTETGAEEVVEEQQEDIMPVDEDEIDLNEAVIAKMVVQQIKDIEEIPSYEQVYTNAVQKSDALSDFLLMLKGKEKQDERVLRRIRTLVESFYALKMELIEYYDNGAPKSIKPTSFNTLGDIFANVYVPLGRPVLNVAKRQYFYKDAIKENESLPADTNDFYNKIFENDLVEYQSNLEYKSGIHNEINENVQKGGGQYWSWLQELVDKYGRPWKKNSTPDAVTWFPVKDTDFFRTEIPDLKHPNVVGYSAGALDVPSKKFPANIETPDKIAYSYMRALGPTYRVDSKKNTYQIIKAEDAPIRNYILFPLHEHSSIGSTRTGRIAVDSEQSTKPPRWITNIISDLGGIQEVPTSTGILALGIDGNTLSNIPVSDYFETLAFSGYGYGDFDIIMRQYGMQNMEYTNELAAVLQKRIDITRNNIYTYIADLRKKLSELVVAAKENPLFDGELQIMEKILSEPILVNVLRSFTDSTPLLSELDVPRVASLLKYQPDLFMAVIGGQQELITKYERLSKRDENNQAVQIRKLKDIQDKRRGFAPVPNKCPHVAHLRKIHNTADIKVRMHEFSKFITKFQGVRNGNWINCIKCKKELICIHELKQLQQYLKPTEKLVIEKELVLEFYGPVMGNSYQCRNCGQQIKEIEYDKNIEFDDEGKPMMGRSEMIDYEEEKKDDIVSLLQIQDKMSNIKIDKKKNTQLSKKIYGVLKDICIRIGVTPDKESYNMMVDIVSNFMSQDIFDIKVYEEMAKKEEEAGKKPLLFNIHYSRNLIYSCAAAILLDIQTKIPSYNISYILPGCDKPGFSGFPLGSSEDKTGLKYITCAILSIIKKDSPWGEFIFKIKESAKKIDFVMGKIEDRLTSPEDGLLMNPYIQKKLAEKKDHLIKIESPDYIKNKPKDILPEGFLPRPIKEVVIDGAAKTDQARADLWIQIANKYAQENAIMIKDSPYSETTCCINPLTNPGEFWKKINDFPKFNKRTITPSNAAKGSRVGVVFKARPLSELLVNIPKNLYFRVFLNICARGPRAGHPHEFNTFRKCYWCNFEYPAVFEEINNFIEETGLSKSAEKALREEKNKKIEDAVRDANNILQSQGLSIDEKSFEELLDNTHNVYKVDSYKLPQYKDSFTRLSSLSLIDPPPSPKWVDFHLKTLIENLMKLEQDSGGIELAEAHGQISDIVSSAAKSIENLVGIKYIKEKAKYLAFRDAFKKMLKLNSSAMLDFILSYFITPFNRLITRLDPTIHEKIQSQYELDERDIEIIKTKIIKTNESVVNDYYNTINTDNDFSIAKLDYFIKQLSAARYQLKKIAPASIIGKEKTLKYIVDYCVLIPLENLLNTTSTPPFKLVSVDNNTDISILYNMICDTFSRFNIEYKVYSDDAIRNILESRREKELAGIIKEFDDMTDEDKAVALILKRVGLGRWAVGGTKAIRQYDPEQQERERAERAKYGIDDWGTADRGISDYDGVDSGEGYGMDGMDVSDNY